MPQAVLRAALILFSPHSVQADPTIGRPRNQAPGSLPAVTAVSPASGLDLIQTPTLFSIEGLPQAAPPLPETLDVTFDPVLPASLPAPEARIATPKLPVITWSEIEPSELAAVHGFIRETAQANDLPLPPPRPMMEYLGKIAAAKQGLVGRTEDGALAAFVDWWLLDSLAGIRDRTGRMPQDISLGKHIYVPHALVRPGLEGGGLGVTMLEEVALRSPGTETISGHRSHLGEERFHSRRIDGWLRSTGAKLEEFGRGKFNEVLINALDHNRAEEARELLWKYVRVAPYELKKFLIRKGKRAWTALHRAAYADHVDILQALVRAYKAVDPKGLKGFLAKKDGNASTALHQAVASGRLKAVEALIQAYKGADPGGLKDFLMKGNSDNQTALHLAAELGRLDILEVLIQAYKSADSEGLRYFLAAVDRHGQTALYLAASKDSPEAVHALIQAYEETDRPGLKDFLAKKSNLGRTALHAAIKADSLEVVQALLQAYKKADPAGLKDFLGKGDIYGETALYMAVASGFQNVLHALIQAYEEIDPAGLQDVLGKRNNSGWTPLRTAAAADHLEVVFTLLKASLDSQALDGLLQDGFFSFEALGVKVDYLRFTREALKAQDLLRLPDPEVPQERWQHIAFLQYAAYANILVRSLNPNHMTGERAGQVVISDVLVDLFRSLPGSPDWLKAGAALDAFSRSDAEGARDMFRAVAREIVLAALLREAQGLGEDYPALERALDREKVEAVVDALLLPMARALIAERGEAAGKDLVGVLEFARDWHKQLHGPLRRVRTIPLEGSWHGLLADKEGRPIGELELRKEPGEPYFPGEIQGWSVVTLTDGEALNKEGKEQDHCVGSYAGDCLSGKMHVLSIRDPEGRVQATVGLRDADGSKTGSHVIRLPEGQGTLEIFQNQGRKNKNPSRDARAVLDILVRRMEKGTLRVNPQTGQIPSPELSRHGPLMQAVGYDPSQMVPYTELQGLPDAGSNVRLPRYDEVFDLYARLLFASSRISGSRGVKAGGHSLFRSFDADSFYYETGLAELARALLAKQIEAQNPALAERLRGLGRRPSQPKPRAAWESD